MYPKIYTEIIFEICTKQNINVESIDNTMILKLTKGSITHYIWSRRFDINNSIASKIADNKYETYKILKLHNVPAVECIKLVRINSNEYNNSLECNFSICSNTLSKYSTIVIKPNNSYEGNDVYKCTNSKQIEKALQLLYSQYKYMVVSPFINAKSEYRAIYFNGEILLIYKKELPYIIGDGKTTLLELLVKQRLYRAHILFTENELNKIYKRNEKINLNWRFNLSQGANCSIVNDPELYSKLSKLAISAASAINITFASVDIIEDKENQFRIIEINSGVAMDQFIQKTVNGKKIALSVYEKVIKHMFNKP